MPTIDKSRDNARRDRVYARRINDGHYRVSSKSSRKAGQRYDVTATGYAGEWQCSCPFAGLCKHIARVVDRNARRLEAERAASRPTIITGPITAIRFPERYVLTAKGRAALAGKPTAVSELKSMMVAFYGEDDDEPRRPVPLVGRIMA